MTTTPKPNHTDETIQRLQALGYETDGHDFLVSGFPWGTRDNVPVTSEDIIRRLLDDRQTLMTALVNACACLDICVGALEDQDCQAMAGTVRSDLKDYQRVLAGMGKI